MFKSLLTLAAKAIAIPLVLLLNTAGYNYVQNVPQAPMSAPAPVLGAFNPSAGGTYRLGASIGSTDTTIRLSSFKEPVSNTLYTMTYLNTDVGYGTLDPQTAKPELISFTGITQNADGSALLTGVTRGLGRSYPYTSLTTLMQPHAGQSIFILSDAPQLFNEYVTKRNAESITGLKTFSSTTPPQYDNNPNFALFASTTFASIGYVANATSTGGVAASETVQGTSQLATRSQASSGTSFGSTGARLVLPTSISTSTCQVATSSVLVSSSTTGKLNGTCFDGAPNYTFSGADIFNASTTFSGTTTINASGNTPLVLNGAPTKWPSANGASLTALLNDGSGNLSWGVPGGSFSGNFATTTLASGNTITLNYSSFGSTPRVLTVDGSVRAANTNISISWFHGTASSTTSGYGSNGTYVTGGTNSSVGGWSGSTSLFQWGDNAGNNAGAYTISSMTATSTVLTTTSPGVITSMNFTWAVYK